MGFLNFTQSTPTSTSSTPPTAPTREQRALCWTARDQFFACLDKNNILDPLKNSKESKSFCSSEDASFQKECRGSWVEHFKKRRVMEHNREAMLKRLQEEGASSMGGVPSPAGEGIVRQ
ncbi:cytochrome oxidase c subunit VIb-domain-containing protein [Tuber borchii]|uniref:Cytochrome oxidase c subunit VIb-domain-containing protein n=1 Tax=Tuber borchii TaxID=42251 RepID=A0A2T6ZNY7_TUBBO|nr:cytochrome oxidase c subunit VIb-domain-containing protein [Tuber borchii]